MISGFSSRTETSNTGFGPLSTLTRTSIVSGGAGGGGVESCAAALCAANAHATAIARARVKRSPQQVLERPIQNRIALPVAIIEVPPLARVGHEPLGLEH